MAQSALLDSCSTPPDNPQSKTGAASGHNIVLFISRPTLGDLPENIDSRLQAILSN
jgi:hypothetical protein